MDVRERLDEDLDPDPRLADERDPLVDDRLVLLRRVAVFCLLATVPVTLPTVADSGAEPSRGRARPAPEAPRPPVRDRGFPRLLGAHMISPMLVSQIPALRDHWYPVAYADDVTTEPLGVRVFGERHVVWRPSPDAAPVAAVDRCPHRAARLSQGWVDDGTLVCPYHGWRYAPDGSCTDIPAADPGVPVPPRACLRSDAAGERYGLVWICVGEPAGGIPDLGEADAEGYTLIHEMMEVWSASAPRIVDNALDVSHVAFVHRGSVGSAANPRLSDYTVERDGMRLRFEVSYVAAVPELQKRNTGITSDLTSRSTEAELVEPLIFRGKLTYHENGLEHVLYKTATPIDDDTTLFCQFIARNDDPAPDRWEDISAMDRIVQAEDKALLEEIESDLPTDVTSEVHIKADRMTLEYRRILGELAQLPSAGGRPPDGPGASPPPDDAAGTAVPVRVG